MSRKDQHENFVKAREAVTRFLTHRGASHQYLACIPLQPHEIAEEFFDVLPYALVAESEHDPEFYDACVALFEFHTQENEPLPAPLAVFVLDVLRGKRARPTTRGRKKKNRLRDRAIRYAVQIAFTVEPTLAVYSSEKRDGEVDSACEIVADCLNEMGEMITLENVKQIWKRGGPLLCEAHVREGTKL